MGGYKLKITILLSCQDQIIVPYKVFVKLWQPRKTLLWCLREYIFVDNRFSPITHVVSLNSINPQCACILDNAK